MPTHESEIRRLRNKGWQDRASLDAEIRFAKLQQWATVTGALTILGVIFHITNGRALADFEKWTAFVLIALLEIGSAYLLCSLQKHLGRTRLQIDPKEKDPSRRGGDIIFVFMLTIAIAAVIVAYYVG
jgi:hypothetical protein